MKLLSASARPCLGEFKRLSQPLARYGEIRRRDRAEFRSLTAELNAPSAWPSAALEFAAEFARAIWKARIPKSTPNLPRFAELASTLLSNCCVICLYF